MINDTNKQIADNANYLGIAYWFLQTMEECGELCKACSHYLRARGIGQPTLSTEEQALKDLSYAMADMGICMEGIKSLLGDEIRKSIDTDKAIAVEKFVQRNPGVKDET